jgi:asparagine synthase (glutamine-hydrolysing)
MGKYLLRKAFDDGSEWLPHSILYRDKAAFSDAVGHSMVDYLKEKALLLTKLYQKIADSSFTPRGHKK